jgi:hypothetical protein
MDTGGKISSSRSVASPDDGGAIDRFNSGEDFTDEQYRELVDTISRRSPLGIYILRDDRLLYTNPQFQRITGFPARS